MDKTQESSGSKYDLMNKENLIPSVKPHTIKPFTPGARLMENFPGPVGATIGGVAAAEYQGSKNKLTPAQAAAIKQIKTAKVYTPPAPGTDTTGAAPGEDTPGAPDEKKTGGGLSSMLEGNNKYIVIAVALLAVYFLFIKKR